MRTLTLLCSLILLASTCGRAQNATNLILDSLAREMEIIAESDRVPGFAVAIVTADGPVFERGYGYANLAEKQPYTINTTQNIGSISKTFIGISLLQAERAGYLSLDDEVNKYLPFRVVHPKYPEQPILLRHLATHTSGISDDKNYDAAYVLLDPWTVEKGEVPKAEYKDLRNALPSKRYGLGEFLELYFTPGNTYYHKKNFSRRAPGQEYEYSNVGAALAAYVLERATNTPFTEWTQAHIFDPLSMNNTAWEPGEVSAESRITHYFSNRVPMPNYVLNTYPDGGLWTSIHQLGRYCSATIAGMESGNDILSREDYQSLLKNHVPAGDDKSSYGNFWEHMDSGFYGHSGGDPGIVTLMYINEKTGYGQLLFVNGSLEDQGFYMEVFKPLVRYGLKLAAIE